MRAKYETEIVIHSGVCLQKQNEKMLLLRGVCVDKHVCVCVYRAPLVDQCVRVRVCFSA